ncbi:LLM class flavin-dependent oxidoreductase [Roseateles cellulosilyticus]|uniref:LLM class flavin-dependent oxidoreductase n=1 Tax=Pelomonas cellulosilytica TaxID=2906762 RepID=A0ABS8XYB3_9BURK|nr:LLM class flavin-dependent oxidoreductase [Pelomonas sp. P8]MCE4556792.1 LLM class flavin-dependent oxidoreductase [Pelomonas sp. P8]
MSSVPRLGYLCLSENPSSETGRALVRQFVLVREADRMGYDDIWIGEQHGDPAWPQGGVLALLGHLAAVTSKARIGVLPLVPALRDVRLLAEEFATLELLSKGRFEFALASGAAIPELLAQHGLDAAASRAALLAAWSLLGALAPQADTAWPPRLAALQPMPRRLWLAADDAATLTALAPTGAGLVAAATHTCERVRAALSSWQAAGGPAQLTLARFACSADTRDKAIAIARPYFESLAARSTAAGWGADRRRSLARDVDGLLAESLIGSHDEVAERFRALAASHGATRVAIVPTSGQFDTHKHILAAFVDEVRPRLDE